MVAFGTGLRINELLALRVEHVHVDTGTIDVDWQLNPDQQWPAQMRPKGSKTRKAFMWGITRPAFESLVAEAKDRDHDTGWLFPRHRSTTGWADQAGRLIAEAITACDWDWTFHWLRHAYASYCLAPEADGGFGLNLPSV